MPLLETTTAVPPAEPLCRDGFLRPYLISVIVDLSNRTSEKVVLLNYFLHQFRIFSQHFRI